MVPGYSQGKCFPKLHLTYLLFGVIFASGFLPQIEGKVFMCYWASSQSHNRTGEGSFTVDNIDPNLCTHLIYSFATVNNHVFNIESSDPNLDHGSGDNPPGTQDMYRKTVALKTKNPDLKILLAVGGESVNPQIFSDMAANEPNRQLFIKSALEMLDRFGFDGIDIDWRYPNADGHFPIDKSNFVQLLKELYTEFDTIQPKPLLTVAIGARVDILESAYILDEMTQYVDYFNVMAYDFKLYNDSTPENLIGHHSPLYKSSIDPPGNADFTVDASITYILGKIDPSNSGKIILGIGTYGRTYTLKSPNKHNFYDEADGPGFPYRHTNQSGLIAYFEICLNLVGEPGWEVDFEDEYKQPYAFNDTQWIGYDDPWSAIHKVNYANTKLLGGMALWSLDMDDCKNYCGGWGNNCHIAEIVKDRWMYLSGSRDEPITTEGTTTQPTP